MVDRAYNWVVSMVPFNKAVRDSVMVRIAPMGSRGGIVVNVVICERTPKALLRLGLPQEHPGGEPGSDGADTQSNGTHARERSGHIS
jgi:hypothetical protein